MTARTKFAIALVLSLALVVPACQPQEKLNGDSTTAGNGDIPASETPQPDSDANGITSDIDFNDAIDAEHRRIAARLITDGVNFLIANRDSDGGWSMGDQRQMQPALTALAAKAVYQDSRFDADSPQLRQALDIILDYQQSDGAIYDPARGKANYTTAIAVMTLAAVEDESLRLPMEKAVAYLRGLQIVPGAETPDGDMITADHPFVGGVSYGSHGRPDLSNVGMWIEGMHQAGVPADDPAIRRALAFVARTQNRSESNPSVWAIAGPNDGGFIYAPAIRGDLTKGESKAGAAPGGRGLRSYGSMTYVGFKSLLYAGLDRDDPRVRAAFKWIRDYWRMDSNPNMPYERSLQGLYHYYHAMAKSLRAWGQPVITDSEGNDHNWRHELIDALARRVGQDGSWINEADRWFEGDPNLVTAYAVLALQEAVKP